MSETWDTASNEHSRAWRIWNIELCCTDAPGVPLRIAVFDSIYGAMVRLRYISMRYFIYCRKSTEAEDRQVLSLDSQEAEVRRVFSGRPDIEIVCIFREAKSAKAPGLQIFEDVLQKINKTILA